MKRRQQSALWHLDRRLVGLGSRIGPRPALGWVRTLRDAFGLSYWQLGQMAGVSGVRIFQIERAELEGTLQIGTLERVAGAFNCRLYYVLVPESPLESMDLPKNRPQAYSTE